MLVANFSKKVTHVAVSTVATKNKTPVHKGLIFIPSEVFGKINETAEDYFSEFFLPGQYKLVCLTTEMGPGELGRVFQKRFGTECNMWIGGILAPFTIKSTDIEHFWKELTQNPKQFLKSKEKRIYSRFPIRGVAVKV